MAKSGKKCSELRAQYPDYFISKNKIQLNPSTDVDAILKKVEASHIKDKDADLNTIDGVKIDFPNEWVQLRKSNTEPIIRVYAESSTMETADALAKKIMNEIEAMM